MDGKRAFKKPSLALQACIDMWVTMSTKLGFLHQRINICLFRYRAQFHHVAIRVAYKHLHISHSYCFFDGSAYFATEHSSTMWPSGSLINTCTYPSGLNLGPERIGILLCLRMPMMASASATSNAK